jgi:phosphate-selective porin OprO and OprP
MKKLLLAVLYCSLSLCAQAQSSKAYKMEFGKGISFISADSTFTMAISGRVQSLFEAKRDITNKTGGADFLLRRSRLNIQGNVLNPKFSYRIQLGFAHGDISAANSASQNNLILRDAMLFYKANNWLRLGFGQTKLPGNRQRQVSSANLQLVERSIANNNFTLDRDKGIWIFNNFNIKKAVVKSTIAISSGEGRIVSNTNGKLSYAGRLEFLPLGEFSKGGELIESDVERESKGKLSIAGVYSFNKAAPRTMGQLGEFLYNSEIADLSYFGADLLYKYKGFSLESELFTRKSNKGIITNKANTSQRNAAIAGTTFMVQSGIFISKTDELAVRYAQIEADDKVTAVVNDQREYVFGYSHFFNKHSLKLQTDGTYYQNGKNESFVYRLSTVITF